jgi:type III pantothenate kinase
MLIAIDIGNTNILVGAFKGTELAAHFRMETVKERTPDEYGSLLLTLFSRHGIERGSLRAASMSCVVPQIKDTLATALRDYLCVEPLMVEPGVKTGMPVITDNPKEVGADRIVNCVAAYNEFRAPLIVADFGTAITFDHVTGNGEYAGGAIAPGAFLSMDALFERTAKLQRVDFSRPQAVIGKNTVDALKSGIYYGFAGLVEGLIDRMKKECRPKKIIATGGYGGLIAREIEAIDLYDEFLVLKGLRIIHEANR